MALNLSRFIVNKVKSMVPVSMDVKNVFVGKIIKKSQTLHDNEIKETGS